MEGKEKIGVSLMKEAIHLKSDMYSTASLPLPIISTISVESHENLQLRIGHGKLCESWITSRFCSFN